MADTFILNPKANPDELGNAISDRLTQARAICLLIATCSGESTGDYIPNTLMAVESLLKDAEMLNDELDRRAAKKAA